MKRIYYISPVGTDKHYSIKREVLSRLASKHHLEFFFPLDDVVAFSVSKAVIDLRMSALVIADLSMERPSCYFELGLAQALGRPVAMIASIGTPLHQAGDRDKLLSYSDISSYEVAIQSAISSTTWRS